MSIPITVLWVLRSAFFLMASALLFLAPEWSLSFWRGPTPESLEPYVMVEARMAAPLLLGLGLLYSAAAMREEARVRRRMSAVFGLLALLGTYQMSSVVVDPHEVTPLLEMPRQFLAYLQEEPFRGAKPLFIGLLLFGCFCGVVQLLYAAWPTGRVPEPHLSGKSDTKPPQLWGMWALQGGLCLAVGSVLMWVPWTVFASWKFKAFPRETFSAAEILIPSFLEEITGTVYIGMAFFSWLATTFSREAHWRLYCAVFSFVSGTYLLMSILVWRPGDTHPAWALLMVPMLMVLAGNLFYWRSFADPVAEQMGRLPDGWTLLDLPAGPFLLIQSLFYRRRSTHLAGVAARGDFEVVDSPKIPENRFFTPGRKLPVQVRFATLTSTDDASMDSRGCSLRLSEHVDVPSSFDMLMNSGTNVGTPHISAFAFAAFTRFLGPWLFRWFVNNDRLAREALIVGRRRAPSCFSLVHYYSQTVRYWVDERDRRWLVRYRIVPADLEARRKESGLPSRQDEEQIWNRDRLPDEHRPSNYLREELKQRLTSQGPIQLMFQGQFHLPSPGDTLDWYNGTVDWPSYCLHSECVKPKEGAVEGEAGESPHAWRDIARVTLRTPLTDAEAELLRFNSENHPPSLGIPIATGMLDYRSLADSERRVIARLQDIRLLMYRVVGLPSFGNTYFSKRRKP